MDSADIAGSRVIINGVDVQLLEARVGLLETDYTRLVAEHVRRSCPLVHAMLFTSCPRPPCWLDVPAAAPNLLCGVLHGGRLPEADDIRGCVCAHAALSGACAGRVVALSDGDADRVADADPDSSAEPSTNTPANSTAHKPSERQRLHRRWHRSELHGMAWRHRLCAR